MAAAIADWPKLVQQAFENTASGGYTEFHDFDLLYYSEDGTYVPELSIHKWATTLLKATEDFGRDPYPGKNLEKWAKEAGFVNVFAQRYKLPIGPWARDKHLKTIGNVFLSAAIISVVLSWGFQEISLCRRRH